MSPFNLLPFDDTCQRGPRRRGALALLAALALTAGCGGGGGDSPATATSGTTTPPVTTTAATAFTQGTITGFGSVIVNGVRFDDTGVEPVGDDGLKTTLSALRLGMRVEVDSGAVDTTAATAKAHGLRFGGLVLGLASLDATTGVLTVLGQTIDVTTTTVFDDSLVGGLAAVNGVVVEVHGVRDAATGHIVATRIEPKTAATAYKLRGTVANLDTTLKTFTIGAATVSYAGVDASLVPSTLANGVSLRVLLATTPVSGVWAATSLGIKAATLPADATTAHVRGSISAFTSATAFSVDGLAVDASTATFADGSAGLGLGVLVEVQGAVRNGVLVATKVELESSHAADDNRRVELHGAITSVNTTDKSFVVRGVTVSYAGTVTYLGGVEAGLVVGARVEVKGGVGSTRTLVQATRIKFES